MTKRLSLRRLNWFLATLIVLINLYIIAVPFWAGLQFWIEEQTNKTGESKLTTEAAQSSPQTYKTNTIIIPRLRLKEEIFEGPTIATANKGIWHRPNSSAPPKHSNTVLVGHRFMYNDPKGVFYNLHKLKAGDKLTVFWKQQRFVYEVSKIKTVPASESSIEDATEEPILTLYTCTPLWSAKDRLVVAATLIEEP